ncbi:hypothetical protein D3C81_2265950 [compost metagenome]
MLSQQLAANAASGQRRIAQMAQDSAQVRRQVPQLDAAMDARDAAYAEMCADLQRGRT